jgi:hypothetical protein
MGVWLIRGGASYNNAAFFNYAALVFYAEHRRLRGQPFKIICLITLPLRCHLRGVLVTGLKGLMPMPQSGMQT